MRGQIIERGDEKYLLRVYVGRDTKGKRQYASKMFYGKPLAAQRALTAMLHESDTETLVRPTDKTFEAFVEEWFAWKVNLALGTAKQYRDTIQRYLLPVFGVRKLHTITPTLVQSAVEICRRLIGVGQARRVFVDGFPRGFACGACQWAVLETVRRG